jgi:5-methylthioadenosine/S-adenosylhomocysteine deaminase
MAVEFDVGYETQPFKTLCQNYPGEDVYPPSDFRVEWGPIFHRGRLDGSAVILMLGQDPAAHESIVRRILVGMAGQRAQGFLRKLGISRSYVMINTFVYSVFGQGGGEKHRNDPKIAAYRHKWLDALLKNTQVEAVVALGSLAASAWQQYRATPTGAALDVTFVRITHPTFPESSSGGNPAKLEQATRTMLAGWNVGLAKVFNALTRRDVPTPLVPYGEAFGPGDMAEIPALDYPPGLPEWMRSDRQWSVRTGADAATRRRTVTVTVPEDLMPDMPFALPPALGLDLPMTLTRAAAPPWAETADPDAEHLALMAAGPVDPSPTGPLALKGRIVCMDPAGTVIPNGVVYVNAGVIVAVQPASAPPPAPFKAADVLSTRGTIYPGLIELHNHLPYNVMTLWSVPERFTDRNVWRRSKAYHEAIVAPMSVLAADKALAPRIARYTECKALFGGVTTSQGITLINSGVTSKYRGLLRNVEQTDEPGVLPEAGTNVSDVEDMKGGLTGFEKSLATASARGGCLLHHLSEGTDDRTRGHFTALRRASGDWALTPALAGIHATALSPEHLDVMAQHGAAIVWSPLSNLLLYGDTTKIKDAKSRGIRIALGSDWSPSGSKNLLGELKAARAASEALGFGLSDHDIVTMATSGAAAVARWDRQLGSIEVGKKADLLVMAGTAGGAESVYGKLIRATESDVRLVVINGIKRYGVATLMTGLTGPTDAVKIAGDPRVLNLENPPGSQFPAVTYTEAKTTLTEALHQLPALARAQETGEPHPMATTFAAAGPDAALTGAAGFGLVLDELLESPGSAVAPLSDSTAAAMLAARAKPLSETVRPLPLDVPAQVDDPDFLKGVAKAKNLTQPFIEALQALY